MAPPDRLALVCPECGALNRAGFRFCFLCNQLLVTVPPATTTDAPKSPTSHTSPELVNPYAPPTTFVSPALTFRISSLLMAIAVIAVCLGVAHENWGLGIVLAVAVAPALLWTIYEATTNKANGRPMAVFEKVGTFLGSLVGVVVIEVSAVIAFVVTCVPMGLATVRGFGDSARANTWGSTYLPVAVVNGGLVGIAVGGYVTYVLITRRSRRARKRDKP